MKRILLSLSLLLCLCLLLVGCGDTPHEHSYTDEWSFDQYHHYHNASCGWYKHRSDVALHEGDVCFCGYNKATFEEDSAPDIDIGDEELGSFSLKNDGTLKFNRIKGAIKYVFTITPPAGREPVTVELSPQKTTVKLNSLLDGGFPAGKTNVAFQAWEDDELEIDGETIREEVPMANAKESFDIIVQNGSFTLRSLVYEDELLRLDGFYRSESDNGVYIHEQLLSNNQPTKYNPAKALTAANGVSYKIYKSAEARANALDSEAYGEFDLSTVSVKHGDNYFYLRAVDGSGTTTDYDLCVKGLFTVELTLVRLTLANTDEYGVRTYNTSTINNKLTVNEGDIIPYAYLFEGVDEGHLGRDEGYNLISRGDYLLSSAYSPKMTLYFYDSATVESDCAEFEQYKQSHGAYTVGENISLSIYSDYAGESLVIPYTIAGKAVSSSTLFYNTAVKSITLCEGYRTFAISLTGCTSITDLYLPSTLKTLGAFAFKDIPASATLHCAFSAEDAGRFNDQWNQINGSINRYTTLYGESIQLPASTAGGLIYELENGELTVVDTTELFRGVIPDEAEYEGVTYPVTAIKKLPHRPELTVKIGKNVKSIETEAFFGQVKGIELDPENTSFLLSSGMLFDSERTRLIASVIGQPLYFLPATLSSIDYYALANLVYNDEDKSYSSIYSGNSSIAIYEGSSEELNAIVKSKNGNGNNRDPYNRSYMDVVYRNGHSWYYNYRFYSDGVAEYLIYTGNRAPQYSTDILNQNIVRCTAELESFAILMRVLSDSESLDISSADGAPVVGFFYYTENEYYSDALDVLYFPDTVKRLTLHSSMFNSFAELCLAPDQLTELTIVGDGNIEALLSDLMRGGVRIQKTQFDALTAINVKDSTVYASNGGVLYNSAFTELLYVPRALSGDVVIPEGITQIGLCGMGTTDMYMHHDFSGTNITSVKFPKGFKNVGMGAFLECTKLTRVEFTDSVECIGKEAFNACLSLSEFTIPTMENYRYLSTTWEWSYLSESTVSIFKYCGNLTSVRFNGTVEEFKVLFNYEKKNESAFDSWCHESYITKIICTDGEYDLYNIY